MKCFEAYKLSTHSTVSFKYLMENNDQLKDTTWLKMFSNNILFKHVIYINQHQCSRFKVIDAEDLSQTEYDNFCFHLNCEDKINSKVIYKDKQCYVKDVVQLARRNSNEWLTEGLIEVFLRRFIRDKHMYLASLTIKKILVDGSHEYLKKCTFNSIDIFCGHFIINNHYLCFYANKQNGQFLCVDPLGISAVMASETFNNWKDFAQSNPSLKSIIWFDRSLLFKNNQPKQIDNYNCGVLVAYFLKNFINENFLFTFETNVKALEKLRFEMAQSIIESVE